MMQKISPKKIFLRNIISWKFNFFLKSSDLPRFPWEPCKNKQDSKPEKNKVWPHL